MENLTKVDSAALPAIYGRSKGAEWFPALYKKDVMILGTGGIGSWLSLLVSRAGATIYAYDMDRFESHNGGQLMRRTDIGKFKTQALAEIVESFSPDCEFHAISREYGVQSETNDIVLCGFDNMDARKVSFANWTTYLQQLPEQERARCFFQDGRLLAEQMQIFNIPGNRPDLIECYGKSHLPERGQVPEPDCTLKQTTHCAAMIASKMVAYLTNWITNANVSEYRAVPFYHEYFVAPDIIVNENGPFE